MSQGNTTEKGSSSSGELLVVNLRGIVNARVPVRTTLEQIGIMRRFSAAIVPNSPEMRGMLSLAKNSVAWCDADSTVIQTLQEGTESAEGKRRVFRLNSPRGGFKRSIRRQYGQGGILGPNPKLPDLVRAMMNRGLR